jgi:hypothetical protein
MGNNNREMPMSYIQHNTISKRDHNRGWDHFSSFTHHHSHHPLISSSLAFLPSSHIHHFFPRPAASVVISAGGLLLGERLQVVVERRVDVLYWEKGESLEEKLGISWKRNRTHIEGDQLAERLELRFALDVHAHPIPVLAAAQDANVTANGWEKE